MKLKKKLLLSKWIAYSKLPEYSKEFDSLEELKKIVQAYSPALDKIQIIEITTSLIEFEDNSTTTIKPCDIKPKTK